MNPEPKEKLPEEQLKEVREALLDFRADARGWEQDEDEYGVRSYTISVEEFTLRKLVEAAGIKVGLFAAVDDALLEAVRKRMGVKESVPPPPPGPEEPIF